MYKVRGVKHSVGEYKGVPYDNMNLYCLCDVSDVEVDCGEPVEVVKMKTPAFNDTMKLRGYQLTDLLGSVVRFTYGKYSNGKPVDFEIVDMP